MMVMMMMMMIVSFNLALVELVESSPR
jgi:hypothetical protein